MRKGFLLAALLLVLVFSGASAQADDAPLLQMLAHVPDTAAGRSFLTYIDYTALLDSRDVPAIHSWAEFKAALDGDQGGMLMAALNGVHSGPDIFTHIMLADDMQNVLGFDFFQTQRAVAFGQPPANAVILEGDYDAQAVIAAHEARGYTKTDANGLTLLCGKDGCESGTKMDLQNQNPSNIFGGNLGRSQPVLVGDGWIASSPDIDTLKSIASASEATSLAAQREYRAAAEAITQTGTLIQSYFIQPQDILPVSAVLADGRLSPEQAKALEAKLKADFVPLPAYTLAVLADSVADGEQQVRIALVYLQQADAEQAAALFPDRLTNALSLRINEPFGDLLTERGVTSSETSVYEASTNRSVMVLTLHAPLPGNQQDESGHYVGSSLVYALFANAYFSRDLNWLATQF